MITLSKSQVPCYLHDSAFCRNLGDDVDEEFSLGERHFKANPTVSNLDDLDLLLNTLRFWIVDSYPLELLDYIWHNDVAVYEAVLVDHCEHLSMLRGFVRVMYARETHRMKVAIDAGDIALPRRMLTVSPRARLSLGYDDN